MLTRILLAAAGVLLSLGSLTADRPPAGLSIALFGVSLGLGKGKRRGSSKSRSSSETISPYYWDPGLRRIEESGELWYSPQLPGQRDRLAETYGYSPATLRGAAGAARDQYQGQYRAGRQSLSDFYSQEAFRAGPGAGINPALGAKLAGLEGEKIARGNLVRGQLLPESERFAEGRAADRFKTLLGARTAYAGGNVKQIGKAKGRTSETSRSMSFGLSGGM